LHRLLRVGVRGRRPHARGDGRGGEHRGRDQGWRRDRPLGADPERARAQAVSRRLAVLGAGPVGLAAALGGVPRGSDVARFEAEAVGAALRRWGPARFFPPLGMTLPPGARDILPHLPDDETLLTGPELVDAVLEPLAASAPLAGRVRLRHRVLAV